MINVCLKNCKASILFLLIGIGLAFFSQTPQGNYLEEEFGLPWLFKLRGSVSVPESVVIISIDELSAQILNLPDDPDKWPRSYYAELINKINQHEPSIIAFNMIFSESRGAENDQLLADAMSQGKNIILSNYLKRQSVKTTGLNSQLRLDRVIGPVSVLERAALSIAPFPLPKSASTVKQFWTYKNSAGDVATFPVAIFECFVFKQAYSEIIHLLEKINPGYKTKFPAEIDQFLQNSFSIAAIKKIQKEFKRELQSYKQIEQLISDTNFSDKKKHLLSLWLTLAKKPNSLYFNYYGNAETITTIPFYQALDSDVLNSALFNNKIVLVGYSETIEPEKTPGLYTVFSNTDSEITSPIEIAATAIANLIDNTWLKPLRPIEQFWLILGWSILLSLICRLFSYRQAASLLILITLVYVTLAYSQFINASIWLPLFVPIILQVPLLLIFISMMHFFKGKKEHKNMQQAFSLYVPDEMVSSFSQHHDVSTMNRYGKLIHGVCMATDAGKYTTLSEHMDPQKLFDLINEYYAVMFPRVKHNQGIISDVVGDAMFAIWNGAEQETQARKNACHTALEIKAAIETFNNEQPFKLPTRFGLHFGEFRLGNVGAAEHYEYRAVGDTVNTAARIEGLNKLLGTQILVTVEVITDLPEFFTREIGFFILKGKTLAVHVYELIADIDQHDSYWHPLIEEFTEALKFFQKQQWKEALAAWLEIERVYPGDGPTSFYIHYLTRNINIESAEYENNTLPTVINIGNITTPLHFEE